MTLWWWYWLCRSKRRGRRTRTWKCRERKTGERP